MAEFGGQKFGWKVLYTQVETKTIVGQKTGKIYIQKKTVETWYFSSPTVLLIILSKIKGTNWLDEDEVLLVLIQPVNSFYFINYIKKLKLCTGAARLATCTVIK